MKLEVKVMDVDGNVLATDVAWLEKGSARQVAYVKVAAQQMCYAAIRALVDYNARKDIENEDVRGCPTREWF